MCMYAKSFHSCLTLCDPLDCILTVSSVHGILGKNTEVGCLPLLQGIFPTPGIKSVSFIFLALAGRFFTTSATWEAPI